MFIARFLFYFCLSSIFCVWECHTLRVKGLISKCCKKCILSFRVLSPKPVTLDLSHYSTYLASNQILVNISDSFLCRKNDFHPWFRIRLLTNPYFYEHGLVQGWRTALLATSHNGVTKNRKWCLDQTRHWWCCKKHLHLSVTVVFSS